MAKQIVLDYSGFDAEELSALGRMLDTLWSHHREDRAGRLDAARADVAQALSYERGDMDLESARSYIIGSGAVPAGASLEQVDAVIKADAAWRELKPSRYDGAPKIAFNGETATVVARLHSDGLADSVFMRRESGEQEVAGIIHDAAERAADDGIDPSQAIWYALQEWVEDAPDLACSANDAAKMQQLRDAMRDEPDDWMVAPYGHPIPEGEIEQTDACLGQHPGPDVER